MSEKLATVKEPAQVYTRKKDNLPGLRMTLVLEDNSEIVVYGSENDPLLSPLNGGQMVMVTKNGNFYNITSLMNEDGEFVKVEKFPASQSKPTVTAKSIVGSVDTDEVKTYIRWHSKILDYCFEQNPEHGDLIYEQVCKKFSL
jgi:hypothetical protein